MIHAAVGVIVGETVGESVSSVSHSSHREHLTHLHLFSQELLLLAHQDLQSPGVDMGAFVGEKLGDFVGAFEGLLVVSLIEHFTFETFVDAFA